MSDDTPETKRQREFEEEKKRELIEEYDRNQQRIIEYSEEVRQKAIVEYQERMTKFWAEIKRQEDEYLRDHWNNKSNEG